MGCDSARRKPALPLELRGLLGDGLFDRLPRERGGDLRKGRQDGLYSMRSHKLPYRSLNTATVP